MGPRTLLRRHGDVALALGVAALMTVELLAWVEDDLVLSVATGLLAALPLAARQRAPLLMFVASFVGIESLGSLQPGFDNDSLAFVLVFFLALYSVGRHAAATEAWLGAVGVLGVMALFTHDEGGLTQADAGDIAFVFVFVGAPWAVGLTLRLRGERETSLRAENERVRIEERSTIARELHDVVAHAISVTVLQSRGARRMLGRDEDAVRRALDAIEHTNTQALSDMRRLLAVLRDSEGDAGTAPLPSLARLDDLVADVRGSGLPVEVEQTGHGGAVPPGVDLSAYRIIQEALTNVLKHAGAATATVRLDYGSDDLRVTVTDTGQGGTPHGPGHGLIGIRERVAVVGGEIEVGPTDGGGFAVRARLPYSVEAP